MSVRVFMVSRDPSAEQAGSATAARLEAYRAAGAALVVRALTARSAVRVLRDGLRTVGKGWVVTAQDPFEAGLAAWFIAWMRGARLELQMHGDFLNPAWWREAWHRPLRLVLARVLLRAADGVRVPGARVARSLAGHVPDGRIVRIPVPARDVTLVAGPRQDHATVLYVGRFSREKDLSMLVRAFAALHARRPQTRLLLVGDGPEEAALKRLIASRGLERAISHMPWTDLTQLHPPGRVVCALPSRHESWNRFVIEAAFAACPVVMTDVGCAGEVIVDGESGWVVPPGDEAAFAAALEDALARPDEAKRRGEAARRVAGTLPNGSEIARRIVAAWEKIAA